MPECDFTDQLNTTNLIRLIGKTDQGNRVNQNQKHPFDDKNIGSMFISQPIISIKQGL